MSVAGIEPAALRNWNIPQRSDLTPNRYGRIHVELPIRISLGLQLTFS